MAGTEGEGRLALLTSALRRMSVVGIIFCSGNVISKGILGKERGMITSRSTQSSFLAPVLCKVTPLRWY